MQRQEAIEAVSLARRGRESWLRLVETDRIASVDYARPLGDGAFCETLRAKLDGDKEVALRVVKSCSKREVLKELKQVVSISGVAVEVFGIAVVPAEKVESDKHLVCLVLELCAHGNLDDFVASHNEAIDLQGRVSIVLGVLERLTKLKEHKVVWRDLKGQNMLVRDYTTRDGRVKEVDFVFSDWGTAISLSKEPNRRMTLNGPGTDGYIAPETKCPQYSYSVDMFAFLVWACSICLDLDKVRPTPLPLLSPLSPLLPSPPRAPKPSSDVCSPISLNFLLLIAHHHDWIGLAGNRDFCRDWTRRSTFSWGTTCTTFRCLGTALTTSWWRTFAGRAPPSPEESQSSGE